MRRKKFALWTIDAIARMSARKHNETEKGVAPLTQAARDGNLTLKFSIEAILDGRTKLWL